MKYPHIQQHDEKDCGAACLSMVAEFYGLKLPISRYRELINVDNHGANIFGIVKGSKEIGLEGEALEGEFDELASGVNDGEIHLPAIARIINELGYEHYIVVYKIGKNTISIGDPGKNRILEMPIEVFKEQWQKQIITFQPNKQFEKKNERKGSFLKFFKYITTQKKMLTFVFIMSIIVSLINISGSLIFEYVLSDVGETVHSTESIGEEAECADDCQEDHEHVQSEDAASDGSTDEKYRFLDTLDKYQGKLGIIFKNLSTVSISIICLYILRIFIQIFRGYLLSKTTKLVDVPLTLSYYDRLMDLPAGFYGTRKTGEYMSRFNDAGKIREAISSTTLTLMLDTIMAIGCGIILCLISVKLFLITLAVMIIYSIIVFLFRNPINLVNHEILENEAQVTSYLKESIDGIETVKAYGYEQEAKTKTKGLYEKFIDKNVVASVIYTIQESLVTASASIGIVVLLVVGANLCVNNIITIADLLIFYYLLSYFLNPIQNLINLQPEIETAIVAADRLNDILDAEPENNDKTIAENLKGDIKFSDVDFRYGSRALVLKNLNMTFKKGKKTAIVGESGCGKTTLTKLLLAFYEPEKGSVTIGGKNIYDYSPKSLRNRIAYIPQNLFLFSDTIYENLRMGDTSITNDRIQEVCKMCAADEFISKLPGGYESRIEENGNNLSGGQKQRLAIARALLRNPDILIMDEATSNLDTVSERSIKKTIDSLPSEITTIIIAHRIQTIRNCDYIYVMEDGCVFEEGVHDALIDKNGRYAEVVRDLQ